jgi:hypothetical protein
VVTAINPVVATSGPKVLLYPNPTNGLLIIDSLQLSDKWKLLDIVSSQTGQTLYLQHLAKTSLVFLLVFVHCSIVGQPQLLKNNYPFSIRNTGC